MGTDTIDRARKLGESCLQSQRYSCFPEVMEREDLDLLASFRIKGVTAPVEGSFCKVEEWVRSKEQDGKCEQVSLGLSGLVPN